MSLERDKQLMALHCLNFRSRHEAVCYPAFQNELTQPAHNIYKEDDNLQEASMVAQRKVRRSSWTTHARQ
ncbi:hypothetical protein KIN20_018921 [Parelaphostrongylus tenuis]|uniref:Uncharacterized protein n=1 Tax=Parelaphostrongylus tenuis TaxID=148309 RepID=A0AAD5QUQ8_PARTN|nr:hypothetical protein KIN20_018921 [Parelaphostrongylus tenuis]